MAELQAVSGEGDHDSPYRYDLAPLGGSGARYYRWTKPKVLSDVAVGDRRSSLSFVRPASSALFAPNPQSSHRISTTAAQSPLVVHIMWRLPVLDRLYGAHRESDTDIRPAAWRADQR